MHRFFINPANITGKQATLPTPEIHHLRTVRLNPGDPVELLDGKGTIYKATLTKTGNQPLFDIISQDFFPQTFPTLSLGQGLLKGKKVDLILQKATELGVGEFFPFYSTNCVVKITKDTKIDRWEKISMEACKQCGNPFKMHISSPVTFNTLLQKIVNYDIKLIFWENETVTHLGDYPSLSSARSIIALIGPEGGFTEEEIASAIDHGFTSISLGKRILRAETASLTATSILQHLSGNL